MEAICSWLAGDTVRSASRQKASSARAQAAFGAARARPQASQSARGSLECECVRKLGVRMRAVLYAASVVFFVLRARSPLKVLTERTRVCLRGVWLFHVGLLSSTPTSLVSQPISRGWKDALRAAGLPRSDVYGSRQGAPVQCDTQIATIRSQHRTHSTG